MTSQPIDLQEVSEAGFCDFVSKFDHVFSDCDGVIWHRSPYPKVGEFFKTMKALGKSVHFVSNNSIRSRENYQNLFDLSQIDNGIENITYPSIAIAEYLKSVNFNKTVFCVTCTETIKTLESYGFKCKVGPDVGADYYADYVKYLEDDLEVGAVVFDSDFKVNITKLYMATAYLKRPEVLFLSGASDKWVPIKKDLLAIGTGQFTEMVVVQSKRETISLGKPGRQFAEFAMKRAGVTDASRVLFIGDMIAQDVGLGKVAGFKTLLLLSNLTYEDMMAEKTLVPDYYARSLGDLVPLLSKL